MGLPFTLVMMMLGCRQPQIDATPKPEQLGELSATTSVVALTKPFLYPSVTPFVGRMITETVTITRTPVALTFDPTYLNFPTMTPTPTLGPNQSLLQIITPGTMSKVISPVEFVIHIAPEYTGITHIELIGEDGVELFRKIFKTYSNIGYYTRVDEKIEFEIPGVAEVARLQISTFDKNGHIQALNSVRLLLQAVGENEFTPQPSIQDRILLRIPRTGNEIQGGELSVEGEFQPSNDLPIILELIDSDGKVLGSRLFQLGPSDGKYQQFFTSIPYNVTKKTNARLIIRQSDDRIEGLSYLFSQSLLLVP